MDNSSEKSSYSSVFDYNGMTPQQFAADTMNRDYLNAIYGGELENLSRDVRYTRTQYLKEIAENERSFEEGKKKTKKYIIRAVLILVIIFLVSLIFFEFGDYARQVYSWIMAEIYDVPLRVGWWAASGFMYTFFFILNYGSFLIFIIFMYAVLKRYYLMKANYNKRMKDIENKKKENMMLGTYDSLR